MTIQITENATILKDFDIKLDELILELNSNQENYKDSNIILDIPNHHKLKPKDLNGFVSFVKIQNANKKSFIIVISDFDFTKTSDKINIVPTIQEAFDVIEIEEIERDLGF